MADLDPLTMRPRGRTGRRKGDPPLQNDGGEGDVDLSEHSVGVLDFADPRINAETLQQSASIDEKDRSREQEQELEQEKRAEGDREKEGRVEDDRGDFSASSHEPHLKNEQEGRAKSGKEEQQTFGNGPHGPVLRKPLLGERGHGPVVRGSGRGGRADGRGRGGPGVSVMDV